MCFKILACIEQAESVRGSRVDGSVAEIIQQFSHSEGVCNYSRNGKIPLSIMRSLFENKRLILVLAALALVALTVLALSLNEVPFRQAQRFGRSETEGARINPQEVINAWVEVPWWQQVGIWILLLVLVILVGYMLSPELRKLLIRRFIRMALTFWGIYYILKNYRYLIPALNLPAPESVPGQGNNGTSVDSAVFVPSQISPAFSYLISFAFALLLLVTIWAIYRGWQKYIALANKPLNEIARIARSSLHDLSSGRDSSDVIINCYLRMSDVVSNKRQLHRSVAMTPHEFALRLEQAGLPGDAVSRLTRLFEAVRYGDRKSSSKDVNEAVNCLTTILHYCGEPV